MRLGCGELLGHALRARPQVVGGVNHLAPSRAEVGIEQLVGGDSILSGVDQRLRQSGGRSLSRREPVIPDTSLLASMTSRFNRRRVRGELRAPL
jgi:hypothetical protein